MKIAVTLLFFIAQISFYTLFFADGSKAIVLTKRAGGESSTSRERGQLHHTGTQPVQSMIDQLRVQQIRQQAQHSHNYPQHPEVPEAEKDFKDFHTRMGREGKFVRGVLNVAIKGDPSADHSAPKTSFREGKKGGKIVETFLQEPSPMNSPNYRSGEAPNGSLCVRIGDCQFIAPNIHSHSTAPEYPKGRIGHTDSRTPNAAYQMDHNIAAAERNGFKYKKTSTHTLANSPLAFYEHPDLLIHAGKESGQYFSILYRPDSPPHPHQQQYQQQQRVPSPSRREFSPIRALQPQLNLPSQDQPSSSRSPSASSSHQTGQKRRFRD